MKINLPAGRTVHRMEEQIGKQYWVDGVPVGEIVGTKDLGMNSYLTVEVEEMEQLEVIRQNYDLYARTPR